MTHLKSCNFELFLLTSFERECCSDVQAAFADQHFDQDYNFCAMEEDPVTKKVFCSYVVLKRKLLFEIFVLKIVQYNNEVFMLADGEANSGQCKTEGHGGANFRTRVS